jgi:hypothetical protein
VSVIGKSMMIIFSSFFPLELLVGILRGSLFPVSRLCVVCIAESHRAELPGTKDFPAFVVLEKHKTESEDVRAHWLW